jgi:hypothetical protein
MKKLIAFGILLLSTASAFAVTGTDVQLRAITVAGAKLDTVGQFDTTVPERLIFRSPGQPDLAMPYLDVAEFSSNEQKTHHLGILATIVVALLMPLQQEHFLTITYTDSAGAKQVATFEVSKGATDLLTPVLEARALNACERASERGLCKPVVVPARQPLPAPHPTAE